MTENLCEVIYQRTLTVNFRDFSLLVGQPGAGDDGEFEEHLEELDFDKEIMGLRTAVHAARVREEEQKQQCNIERAPEFIHNEDLD